MPPAAVSDFMDSRDRSAPGMVQVAAQTGRSQFLVFGEGFGIDKPFEDKQARKIETYVGGERGGEGGQDHFDTQAPLYQYIKRLTQLRRDYRVLSRGVPTVLRDNPAGPGALAYRMENGAQQALVVFNTANAPVLLDNLVTGLPGGSVLKGVFARDGAVRDEVVEPSAEHRVVAWAAGTYRYPTDTGWTRYRQLDLRRVQVLTSGASLRLDLTMNAITMLWNPANGFDHVAFTIYVELPGRSGGASVMPLQNAVLPDGMQWHYRLRAHGWSNALFASAGASASHERWL